MHASRSDPEDAFDVPEIALSMPPRAASASSIAAPEPLVDEDSGPFIRLSEDDDLEDELASLAPPPIARSRLRVPHFIIAVSAIVCVATVVLALRDRAHESALFRTAQANRARAAVTAMAAPAPALPAPVVAEGADQAAPIDAAELAATAEARVHETARGERFEAQVALEIGDLVRAARVAQQSVWHDPSEADGWLLLTAAQLELNRIEASRTSLQACADNATHGPRWECLALMHDNGPEGFTP